MGNQGRTHQVTGRAGNKSITLPDIEAMLRDLARDMPESLQKDRPPGFVKSREIAEYLGVSKETALKKVIRPAMAAGLLECRYFSVPDITGRCSPAPMYRRKGKP